VTQRTQGAAIRFDATLSTTGTSAVLRLPEHAAGISAGDTAALDIEMTKDWPEPSVPQDLSACTDPDLSKNGRLIEPGDDRP